MARMMLVGFFAGAFVSRPYMLATCLSSSSDDDLNAGFRPPVQVSTMAVKNAARLRGNVTSKTTSASISTLAPVTNEVIATDNSGNTTAGGAFTKHHGVVIGMKIHGPPHVPQLKQSLCLLNQAYNNRMNYDIVIFTTLPLADADTEHLKEMVHPASLIVVTDKQTLSDQVNAMSKNQKNVLFDRCNVTSRDELFWWTRCCEGSAKSKDTCGHYMPIAYSWQSEFRSKQIWTQKALEKYKYMMWYDSDAMSTKIWQQDPVDLAVRNNLAILFDHFPQGKSKGADVAERVIEAYGTSLCKLKLQNGHFEADYGDCNDISVPQVHGFFHVTNLDFYRLPQNLKWANVLIGETKFSRRWDDQLAVTVPPAMLAPERAWEMEANGVKLDVWHNQFMDGKRRWRGGGYQKWWQSEGKQSFPEAWEVCKPLVVNGG